MQHHMSDNGAMNRYARALLMLSLAAVAVVGILMVTADRADAKCTTSTTTSTTVAPEGYHDHGKPVKGPKQCKDGKTPIQDKWKKADMADTGFDFTVVTAAGIVLVAAGIAAVLVARKRSRS